MTKVPLVIGKHSYRTSVYQTARLKELKIDWHIFHAAGLKGVKVSTLEGKRESVNESEHLALSRMAFCGSRVQAFQQYLEEKIQECKCCQRQEKVPLTVQTGNAPKQAWNHRKEHFLIHFMLKRKINVPNTREAVWPKEATRLHTHPDGHSHETLTDIDLGKCVCWKHTKTTP